MKSATKAPRRHTRAGKSGAQCAEITGVSEEEIRRAGRWNDLRNHRWTKLGVGFLAQHTQLVKSWLLPFYYLDLFRTVTTAIKLDIGKRNNVLTEPELLEFLMPLLLELSPTLPLATAAKKTQGI